jgi:hypothetical protein
MKMKRLMLGRFKGFILLLVVCLLGAPAHSMADEDSPAEEGNTPPPTAGVTGPFPDSLIARYSGLPNASIHRFRIDKPDFFVAHNPMVEAKTAPSPPAPMNVVEDAALELIRRAPSGAVITIAFFRLTTKDFDAAVKHAADRDVRIHIVLGALGSSSATQEDKEKRRQQLVGILGPLGSLTVCTNGSGSCLGNGIMHNKFITVTEVCRLGVTPVGKCILSAAGSGPTAYHEVVYQGTQNFQGFERRQHNIASVIIRNSELYSSYARYFFNLVRNTKDPGLELEGFSHIGMHMWGHVFPRALKIDAQDPFKNDLVVLQLDAVNCSFNAPEKRPTIRIAMGHWTNSRGQAIAGRLGRLKSAGCSVEVLVPNAVSENGEYEDAFRALTKARVKIYTYPAEAEGSIHAKYMLINARFQGSARARKLVFFGSMNFTNNAAMQNDETWLLFEQEQDHVPSIMFDQLLASFMTVRDRVVLFKPPVMN